MDPDLLVIFGSLGITGITLGAMALLGWRIWVHRRPHPDSKELAESLRSELRASIQDEIAKALEERDREFEEFHERLDFAERLLTQARLPRRTDGESSPGT